MERRVILMGDAQNCLSELDDDSIDCCVTSPPYFRLRDYGVDGQVGMEESPEEYIEKLVLIFREVKRVLRPSGTLWLNIGDSYLGSGKGRTKDGMHRQGVSKSSAYQGTTSAHCKRKDLIGIPWMLAFALRSDGWYLRQDIIWEKPNAMPESVKDRCTKSHEYIFLLSKNPVYFFDSDAILEEAKFDGRHDTTNKGSTKYSKLNIPNGKPNSFSLAGKLHERWRFKNGVAVRNKRDVWHIPTQPFKGEHFATFPEKLVESCISAVCPIGGTVLAPFCGSGTAGLVAMRMERNFVGIELNPAYAKMAKKRIEKTIGLGEDI